MSLNDSQQLFGFFFTIYFFIIIDRSHVMYQTWDTYSAWMGKTHNLNRLVLGWLILVILPITHFAILFTLLGLFNVTLNPTISGVIIIILISISSFFTFGYFRLYESLVHGFPVKFFTYEDQTRETTKIRPHFLAHFIPGILYVILSTLLLVITLYL
ncbi:hypothetical protein [Methanospirillum lacunae]|uniref:Uncharacterized protein n=1 Tax=Methanospirillum lacunae TaxID=668570 RepID=A0A2V2ND21_9EURY|nr:hypothetical protein DK846_03680 [Methanospirillum lacunae]